MSEPVPVQGSPESFRDPTRLRHRAHEIVKNSVIEFCQLLFDGQNYPLKWMPEQNKTEIGICDKYTFNLDQVMNGPVIVANRGPLAWAKQSGIARRQEMDLRTGATTYTDLVRGGVTLSCFSRVGLEAEDIAGFIFESMSAFRITLRNLSNQGRILRTVPGLFQIETTSMGEEALVKSSARPDLSVVPVAIAAIVQRRWQTEPTGGRKLQQVITRTSIRNP